MSWTDGPLLGFDTETTGVDVDNDRIVTAALVRRDETGTHIRSWLINPGVDIPEAAAAIHGISTEHARTHGAKPKQALEEIAAELAQAFRDGVPVVAYNATFDLCLLDAELRRHRLRTLPDRLCNEARPVIDPLVLDRAEDQFRRGKRKLVDLCGFYEVVESGALHTADVDVVATLDVLERIVGRFPHLADAGPRHAARVPVDRPPGVGRGVQRLAPRAGARRPRRVGRLAHPGAGRHALVSVASYRR